MKKVVGYLVAFVILVIVLCIPAVVFYADNAVSAAKGAAGDEADEPTSITDYVADFDVEEDGDLRVVEKITVDFPIYPDRHGIFRFWDRVDESAPRARRIVEDVKVTLDGGDVDVDLSTRDGGRFDVARIGSEDEFVEPGEHTYEISYRIDGVLEPGGETTAESQFYWQLVPAGWQQTIAKSRLTVHLPVPAADDVKCAVGLGTGEPCEVQGAGTDTLVVTTGPLSDHTPVTLLAGVDVPTPEPGTHVAWSGTFDPVLGRNTAVLGAVALFGVGAAAGGSLLARRTVEHNPQFPLMYAPPEGVGPAQAAFVLNESVDRTTYVSSLMYAAERGAVDLRRDGEVWTITDKAGAAGWAGVDDVTRHHAALLGGPGASFAAHPKDVASGQRLKSDIEGFDRAVEEWAVRSGNVTRQPLNSLMFFVVLGLAALTVFFVWKNPFDMSAVGLVPGAAAIAGLPFLRTGADTKRTRQGRDLWSRVGGFHRVLSTPSSQQRFEFSGREELYTAYVPWAAAFGCADAWADKFRTETGYEPPGPAYIGGYYGGYAGGFDSIVHDFDSTLDSAIDAYDATQRSSGSGGGGFSGGGGGGGGGGGSW